MQWLKCPYCNFESDDSIAVIKHEMEHSSGAPQMVHVRAMRERVSGWIDYVNNSDDVVKAILEIAKHNNPDNPFLTPRQKSSGYSNINDQDAFESALDILEHREPKREQPKEQRPEHFEREIKVVHVESEAQTIPIRVVKSRFKYVEKGIRLYKIDVKTHRFAPFSQRDKRRVRRLKKANKR